MEDLYTEYYVVDNKILNTAEINKTVFTVTKIQEDIVPSVVMS